MPAAGADRPTSGLVLPDGLILTPEFIIRFHAKIERRGECDVWTRGVNENGYGRVKVGGRTGKVYLAHRISWFLATGELPPSGTELLHSCDNPPCQRFEHLSPGTHAKNMQDAVDRGLRAYQRQGATCRAAGHDLTDPTNVYVRPSDGLPLCRRCRTAAKAARRAILRGRAHV